MKKYRKNTAIFLDIETAVDQEQALKMKKVPVAWIAALAVDLDTGDVLETFEQKVHINLKRADREVLGLIGYNAAIWNQEACYPAAAARKFSAFCRKYAWVTKTSKAGNNYQVAIAAGHNIRQFDLPVLMNWYEGLSEHFNKKFWLPLWYSPLIDTLEMYHTYQVLQGEFTLSAGLAAIAERHNIELPAHHNALNDTHACLAIYLKLVDHLRGATLML